MTIAVDEVNAISGMLQPGDRIDLLFSARVPAAGVASPSEVTRPLMQDLRVLATGRQVRPAQDDRGARLYTTITVEVQPIEAQKLVVAQRAGKLTALLRNPGDRETLAARPMDLHGLLGLPSSASVSVRRSTELIVGGIGHSAGKALPDEARAVRGPVASAVPTAPLTPPTPPAVAPPSAIEPPAGVQSAPVLPTERIPR
jgi:pilus assembly protein CpaB